MVRLRVGDRLYINSSENVNYIVVAGSQVLANYRAYAGSTRLVYEAATAIILTEISISGSITDATIKFFLNGTSDADQIFEAVIPSGYNVVLNSSGWIGNTFTPSDPPIVETNSDAIKTSLDTIDNAIAGNEMQVDVVSMPTTPVTGPLTDSQLRATPVPVSVSGTLSTTGSLTDAELRASPLQVDGPLTDAEIRATPLPVSGTMTANAGTDLNTSALALETTQQDVKAAVEGLLVTEDAALPIDPSGVLLLVRSVDTLISEVSANRDAIALNASKQGELYTHLSDIAIGLKRTLQALERPPYMDPTGRIRADIAAASTTTQVPINIAGGSPTSIPGLGAGLIDQTFTYYTQNRDVFNNWKNRVIT